MHWDEAYAIGLDGDIWLARFHGSADELRAHTSTELRQLIRADYAYRQQARRVRAVDLDDGDLDDDYAAHFDSAHTGSAHADTNSADAQSAQVDGDEGGGDRDDAEPGRQAGVGRPAPPRGSYANLRGERMST
jgi:hypothetical protein